jgi:hypothetical protein
MCFSKAPKVKPIPAAPTASPEAIDDIAVKERDDLRRKRRLAYGRQSTILAGGLNGGAGAGAPPTAPVKTAIGS